MQVVGIDHVVLRVTDLERMIDFYTRVLGCPVDHRQDALGLVHLRAGPSLIDLVDISGPLGGAHEAPHPGGRNMDHLCLRIDAFDPDQIAHELQAQGIEPGEIGLRYGSTGRATSLYLRDPEGNGLELRG
jgi:catechol 2,3-dioxygenase-like lactoylglutathione lyase family enzyme